MDQTLPLHGQAGYQEGRSIHVHKTRDHYVDLTVEQ